MMFVSEFITDAPSAMPAEASVLPLEPIKVDEAAAASVRSLGAMLLTQSAQTA